MEPLKSKVNKGGGGGEPKNGAAMEMRPGGMFVQKRESEAIEGPAICQTINVRVKFGSMRRDVRIHPQASFGELKKMLADCTGVHHLDQKIFFKKEEKLSREFLDEAGVKEGSKLLLLEDSKSRDRRCLEMVQSAKIESAKKSLRKIGLEVDVIQGKVQALESAASKGAKAEEMELDGIIDALMKNLVALEGIFTNGSLKMEKNLQECRVKKQIEVVDSMKRKRSTRRVRFNLQDEILKPKEKQQQQQSVMHTDPVVITTKWVTFE